jgi:very-short-patch-repair endonuclease
MIFDQRQLTKYHVLKAIERYIIEQPRHFPARSAFLLFEGKKLPAKYILRLAFLELTGHMPTAEQTTGGRASVLILNNLGFNAVYEKPSLRRNRNLIKNARREALNQILRNRWGTVEIEYKFDEIKVPDLEERKSIGVELLNILNSIEAERNIKIKGKINHKLPCDFYLPEVNLIIEFDERQHFTLPRAASLREYSADIYIGFDKKRWIDLCTEINAGDNSPIYRDEQRAFYDSLRDIIAPQIGLKPVVRIFEEDVLWEKDGDSTNVAKEILQKIQKVVDTKV